MKALTKYKEGSIRELFYISFPLMISSFGTLMMIFVDRCFLAHYSIPALNASVNSGTLAWAFLWGVAMLTAMSEVFVGQYNGAQKYDQIGVPVWQMIWISILSYALFLPAALFLGPVFFNGSPYSHLEIEYFKYMMLFGPFYPLMTALSGFFVGQGKTRFIIYLAILANILNIALDWVLIFGIKDIVPEMGIKGAAISTSIGSVFQAGVIFVMFLKKSNQEKYGSNKWKINFASMKKCFNIGLPQGIFYTLEIIGLSVFFLMMTSMGEKYITISSICQSIILLLSFFLEGLSRGVTAIAGNFIGAKRYDVIKKLLKSAICLELFFYLIVGSLVLLKPHYMVSMFVSLDNNNLNTVDFSFYSALYTCLVFAFVFLFFEGIRWIYAGILIAAGDSFFLLLWSLSIWLFFILPVYFIVNCLKYSVETAWLLYALYAGFLCFVYWIRYRRGRWRRLGVIEEKFQPLEESLE